MFYSVFVNFSYIFIIHHEILESTDLCSLTVYQQRLFGKRRELKGEVHPKMKMYSLSKQRCSILPNN